MEEEKTFNLTDEQVSILDQNAQALRSYHAVIGEQFCELMKSFSQAASLEKNIESLQNEIAKELKLPRAGRINWNLLSKTVEIVD
jgi:hypothetical protein